MVYTCSTTCDNKLHIQDTPVHSSKGADNQNHFNIVPIKDPIKELIEEGEGGGLS